MRPRRNLPEARRARVCNAREAQRAGRVDRGDRPGSERKLTLRRPRWIGPRGHEGPCRDEL